MICKLNNLNEHFAKQPVEGLRRFVPSAKLPPATFLSAAHSVSKSPTAVRPKDAILTPFRCVPSAYRIEWLDGVIDRRIQNVSL